MLKKIILAVLLVSALSSWTWSILAQKPFLLIIGIILSILICFEFEHLHRYRPVLIILSFLLLGYLFFHSFDKGLLVKGEVEYAQMIERQAYYSREFGKVYQNRFGIFYSNLFRSVSYKYLNNLASNLDLEIYFDVNAFFKSRFNFLLLPFMLLGGNLALKQLSGKGFVFLAIVVLVSGFIKPDLESGPIIFYSLVNSFISLGLIQIIKKKKI